MKHGCLHYSSQLKEFLSSGKKEKDPSGSWGWGSRWEVLGQIVVSELQICSVLVEPCACAGWPWFKRDQRGFADTTPWMFPTCIFFRFVLQFLLPTVAWRSSGHAKKPRLVLGRSLLSMLLCQCLKIDGWRGLHRMDFEVQLSYRVKIRIYIYVRGLTRYHGIELPDFHLAEI